MITGKTSQLSFDASAMSGTKILPVRIEISKATFMSVPVKGGPMQIALCAGPGIPDRHIICHTVDPLERLLHQAEGEPQLIGAVEGGVYTQSLSL